MGLYLSEKIIDFCSFRRITIIDHNTKFRLLTQIIQTIYRVHLRCAMFNNLARRCGYIDGIQFFILWWMFMS